MSLVLSRPPRDLNTFLGRRWLEALTDLVNKSGRAIFDHFEDAANAGIVGAEDLYSDTILANTLIANGDKLAARYFFTIAASATATRRVQAYFGGTSVVDSGVLTFATGGNIEINLTIIRESSSAVRVNAELVVSGIALQPIVTYTRITALTLTNSQILKVTGSAAGVGAAAGDITAKFGTVEFISAA